MTKEELWVIAYHTYDCLNNNGNGKYLPHQVAMLASELVDDLECHRLKVFYVVNRLIAKGNKPCLYWARKIMDCIEKEWLE